MLSAYPLFSSSLLALEVKFSVFAANEKPQYYSRVKNPFIPGITQYCTASWAAFTL
jgi:hypothetical protein